MEANTESLELPVPDDYVPSAGELNNFVYLTCKYTVGWIARSCDHMILLNMAGGPENIRGNAGLTTLAKLACDYCWDHIAGEPDEYSPETLFNHMKPFLQEWFKNTTVEERAVEPRLTGPGAAPQGSIGDFHSQGE